MLRVAQNFNQLEMISDVAHDPALAPTLLVQLFSLIL